MRWAIGAVIALCVAAAIAGGVLLTGLPTAFVRDSLAARILARTGRAMTVTGPISVSFFPDSSLHLHGVTIGPPPGTNAEPLLTAGSVTLKVPLWPLLSQRLQIEAIEMADVAIVLKTAADGQRNWDLRKPDDSGPHLRSSVVPAGAAPTPPAAPMAGTVQAPVPPRQIASLKGLRIRDLRITSGTLQIIDERAHLSQTLTDLALRLQMEDPTGPVRLDGAANWGGEQTTVAGSFGPLSNLLAGDGATLDLTVGGRLLHAAIHGNYVSSGQTPIAGHLELSSNSMTDLAHWLAVPLPGRQAFGPMALTADIGVSSLGFDARNATLALNGANAKGEFSLLQSAGKPSIKANLTIDTLDLDSFVGPKGTPNAAPGPAGAAAPIPTGAAAPVPTVAAAPIPADSAPMPANSEHSWSDQPIDLSGLGRANADMTIMANAMHWHGIKTGPATLKAGLRDGTLKTRLTSMELYGGKGSGTVTLSGNGPSTKVDADFVLRAVEVQPLLNDAAGFNRLGGKGDVSFGISGTGRSQLDIVRNLAGQGRMELSDGALHGFDVMGAADQLEKGHFSALKPRPSDQTSFAGLTASCTITGGVLDNRDLAITAPNLKLSGAGTANLPMRTLDYSAQAALGATEAAATSPGHPGALTIPLRIAGPWSQPHVTLDIKAIVKNPQAALETLKHAAGKFATSKQGKALGEILGGLLGRPTKQGDSAPALSPAQ